MNETILPEALSNTDRCFKYFPFIQIDVKSTKHTLNMLQQQQKMNIDRLICNLSNVIEFSVKREILNTHSLRYMLNYRFFITIIHNTPAESTAHRRQVPDVIPAIIIINCCPCVCVRASVH